MKNDKTAILLVNVGTPDNLSLKAVRKFLSQFLNDKRVIDLPFLLRKLLVNLIIVPFRSPKSAKLYQKLWTKNGSPLLYHSLSLKDKLQTRLQKDDEVFLAMRYQNPSIKEALLNIKAKNFDRILLFPLYPQYATSTTLTTIEETIRLMKKLDIQAPLSIVDQFFDQEEYLNAFIQLAQEYNLSACDHILFSYHGLPVNQVEETHPGISCEALNCTSIYYDSNIFCYHAACYQTTKLIAEKLKLKKGAYSVCFQSRLSKNWLSPFTDEVIIKKANEGIKNILVFCPSFVTDCLETTIEIEDEYKELFLEKGGKSLQLVKSLNDSDAWADALNGMIYSHLSEEKP